MALIESILIIIVILIVLVIVFHLFYSKSHNTILSGIHQSHPLIRVNSNNLPKNVSSNFTWALWFFVNDWNINYGQIKPILIQSAKEPTSLEATPSAKMKAAHAPELNDNNDIAIALDKYENDLLIGIKTFSQGGKSPTPMAPTDYFSQQLLTDKSNQAYETYKIENVNIQKWVCLIISVDGRTLDIYLHGKLVKTFILPNTIKGEKENVYLGSNKSYFDGHIAQVQYYANSVNTQEAYNIYREGLSSDLFGDIFDKYRLKIQFLEYNHPMGKPLII